MNLKIIQADYHRNGVGGEPFYAILFEDAEEPGTMIASLFKEPNYCAVYNVEKLSDGTVEFSRNSWRGDRYEYALRPLLDEWLKKHMRLEAFA